MSKVDEILDSAKYLDGVGMPQTATWLREFAAVLTQDAGPMARHWREAIDYYGKNFELGLSDDAINMIENRARELAAKEAK